MREGQTMKELRPEEQPYEKCLQKGAEYLTDIELLSVIIRTGVPGVSAYELAGKILRKADSYQGLRGIRHLTLDELQSIRGVGRVKAIQVKCIAELSRRIAKSTAACQVRLSTPSSVAEYFMEDMRHEEQEQLVLLMVNTKNCILKEKMIFKGTVNYSCVSPREIFIEAVRARAVHIVLVHNHPSGDPTPSEEDILMTRQVQEAGELIGITLLDHIIIGDNCYVSLKEKKLLP
ncbi:MAG: DNA repair protein RadC [Lachnospiraceae bacterium]|nr:DNA repair protein RadC [Lachnospiraceae bacterium]